MRDTEDVVRRVASADASAKESRRQVVEETLVPGASIAGVALKHRLNANLVFTWRRSCWPALAPGAGEAVKLLAGDVTESSATGPAPAGETRHGASRCAGIERAG